MDISETLERMVLDLMVKGVIDQKELRPSFAKLSDNLSDIADIKGLLDDLDKALNTPPNSPDMSSRFQKTLQILEEIGNRAKQHRQSTKGLTHDIPDRLSYNTETETEIIESFQLEVSELFEKLEHDLLLLERSPESVDMISTIMGHLHSIKGIAGFLDFTAIQKLTHMAESALGIGLERQPVSTQACDALLRTKDMCTDLVEMLFSHLKKKSRRNFPKLPPTYPLLFKELVKLSQGEDASVAPPPMKSNSRRSLEESSAMEAAFLATSGSFSVEEASVDEDAKDTLEEDETDVEYEEYTEDDLNHVFGNLIQEAEEVANATLKSTKETQKEIKRQTSVRSQLFDSSDNVRLKLSKLETLLDLIGEVVIAHSQVLHDPALLEIHSLDLERKLAHLSKCIGSLQALGMNLRVFPVQQLFAPLSRTARDLAVKLNKDVEVSRIGEDAELDKSVLQALTDPLMHMVRNAVGHGLESPSERKKQGKPARGQIKLLAQSEGGMVRIEVADDGYGLDREKIIKKAKGMGLIDSGAGLTDEEVWQFIFAPGFSTTTNVSEVSGRGVGLDVVQRGIQRLGGRIQVTSTKGKGTTFTLSLPLTLAMIEGLIVNVGAQKYIVPRSTVGEILRPRRDQISSIHGREEMFLLRGETMPLIRLHDFLGLKRSDNQHDWNALVMVIKNLASPFGLMVDAVSGQQQVVLKNLGDSLASQRGISGCAILGDGRVGLVLNPEDIQAYAMNTSIHEVA